MPPKKCPIEGCTKWEFAQGVCKAHASLAATVAPAPTFCSGCGAKLTGESAFCSGCGAKIPGKEPPVKESKKETVPASIPDTGLRAVVKDGEMSAEAREVAAQQAFSAMGFEGYKPPPTMCVRCKDLVDLGDLQKPFVHAHGKYFHAGCFTCKECNIPLQNEPSFLLAGDYVCSAHQTAVMCHGCNNSIGKGQKLEALTFDWHPSCFICVVCGIGLADQAYYAKDGNPYCKPDYKTKFPGEVAPVDLQLYSCAGCKDWIKSAAGYTETEAGKFHPVCFETYKASKEKKDTKFCAICNVAMVSWVEINSKCYHSECLTCVNCKGPIPAESVVSKKGKFWCTPCHKDPFREV